MAQYQVPQFIDIEDRIIGPLTLKQFLYLAAAGALLFILWFLLNFFVWVIFAIPIAAAAAAFAFLKVNDRPFIYFFLAALSYFLKPRLYVWSARPREIKEAPAPRAAEEIKEGPPAAEKVTRSRLKELALNLDVAAKRNE